MHGRRIRKTPADPLRIVAIGGGTGLSAAIAAAGTKSIGEAAIVYYFVTHPSVETASLPLQKRKRAAKSVVKPKKDLKSKFSSAKK